MSKRRKDAHLPPAPPRSAAELERRLRTQELLRGIVDPGPRLEPPKRLPKLYYSNRVMTKEEIASHNARLAHVDPYEMDTVILFNEAMLKEPEPVLDPEPNMAPPSEPQ